MDRGTLWIQSITDSCWSLSEHIGLCNNVDSCVSVVTRQKEGYEPIGNRSNEYNVNEVR
jgi:hypothetical protein